MGKELSKEEKAPAKLPATSNDLTEMTVGGGCFWCVDSVYRHIGGVSKAVCGYAGGHVNNPTYEDICTGQSGHAEVVRVWFDPSKITYDRMLEIFFKVHNPTTLNQQGNDCGTQYRSTIMYHNEEQAQAAERQLKRQAMHFVDPIVTEVVECPQFWPAEEYHQDYWAKNPGDGYCSFTVAPKV